MASQDQDLSSPLIPTIPPPPDLILKDFEVLQNELLEIKGELKAHSGPVTCFSLSKCNQYLLSGSSDKTIILWDVHNLRQIESFKPSEQDLQSESFKAYTCEVLSVAFNLADTKFMGTYTDGSIKVWHMPSKLLISSFKAQEGPVTSGIFSPSDEVVSTADDGSIKFFSLSGNLIKSIKIHSSSINSIKFSADNKFIISCSSDKTIKIFNILTEEISKSLEVFNENAQCLDVDLNFIVSSSGVLIVVWNLEDFSIKCRLTDSKLVKSLKLAHDSKLLLTCSDAFYLTVWDLGLEKKVYGLSYYPNTTLAVVATKDFQKVFIGLSDKTIKVFNTASRKDYYTLFGHKAEVNQVKVTKCGEFLVSASSDSTVNVWDIEGKRKVMVFELPDILCITLGPKHNHILAGYSDSKIQVWDSEKSTIISTHSFHKSGVNCISTSTTSQLIASSSLDLQIILWDYSTSEPLMVLKGHSDQITSLALIKSSILSTSADRSLYLWDTLQSDQAALIKEFDSSAISLSKSKTDSIFAACSKTGEVGVWESESFQLKFSKKFEFFIKLVKILESQNFLFLVNDNGVTVINYLSGSQAYTLKTFTAIHSIEISSDEKTLITGMADCKILSWDLTSRKISKVSEGHTSPVHSLLLSSNPSAFYSSSQDKSIRLWSFTGKTPSKLVNLVYGKILCMVLTSDRKTIITGNDNGEVRYFNINSKKDENSFKAHSKAVKCMEISNDNLKFVTGSSDGLIKIWETQTRKLLTSFNEVGVVNSVAFTEDLLFVVSAGEDKLVKLWSIKDKRLEFQFVGHLGVVNMVKVVAGRIFSASGDKTVKVWSILTRKLENSIQNSIYGVSSIDVHPNQKLAIYSDYNKIHVWDLEENHKVFTLDGHLKENIKSILFSPNGKYVISASVDSSIKLWNIKNMCEKSKFTGSPSSALSLCTNKSQSLIISGTEDGWLKVWTSSYSLLMNHQEHQEPIRCLAYNDKYSLIASGGKDKSIKLWDLSQRTCKSTLQGHGDVIKSLIFAQDSEVLVSGSWDKTIKVWDFKHGVVLFELNTVNSQVSALALEHENFLISGHWDKLIRLWDLNAKSELATLAGHKGTVSALAVWQDVVLASGGQDGGVLIWDLTDKSLKGSLQGHSKEVSCLAFVREGKVLVTAGFDREVKAWDLQGMALVSSCVAAGNNVFAMAGLGHKEIVLASGDKSISVWSCEDFRCSKVLMWPEAKAKVIKKHESSFYIGYSSGSVCIYDSESSKFSKCLWLSNSEISDIRVNSTGTLLVAGGMDKNFIIFDLVNTKLVQSLPGHTNTITSVEITSDCKYGISGSADSSIKVWNLSEFKEEFTLSGHKRPIQSLLSLSKGPGKYHIISTSMDTTIKIWDLNERSEIKVLKSHSAPVTCSALIQNEQLLVTGSADCSIKVWDYLKGVENFYLNGHTGAVVAVCESEDQERIISGGVDCD